MAANNLAGAVEDYIRQQGGVSGVVKKFEALGLGAVAKSWMAKGQNLPISSAQIQRAVGFDTVAEIAKKCGVAPDAAAAQIADLLPALVDKMTIRKGSGFEPYPWTGTRKR
jgi:uncharacterized protein YidB (DUF937 family)